MKELMEYLATVPWHSHGTDGHAWVETTKILQDTEITREDIYKMASEAKPRGLIRWSFLGLHSIRCLSRLSITKTGIQWLRDQETRAEDSTINPEFLMKDHLPH